MQQDDLRPQAPAHVDPDHEPEPEFVEEALTGSAYRKFCEGISKLDSCRTEIVAPLNDKLDVLLHNARTGVSSRP